MNAASVTDLYLFITLLGSVAICCTEIKNTTEADPAQHR